MVMHLFDKFKTSKNRTNLKYYSRNFFKEIGKIKKRKYNTK